MRLRKTITAAIFFLALFISQAGYFFIYSIQQHYYKEQAENKLMAGIPDEMLTAIDVSVDGKDMQWREEGREFYLQGELYDVAKIKNVNGKELIYCFNDRDESKVLQQLNKVVRSGNDQNSDSKNSKQTIKFQFSDLIIAAKKNIPSDCNPASNYLTFNDNIVSTSIEVKGPPPKGPYITT